MEFQIYYGRATDGLPHCVMSVIARFEKFWNVLRSSYFSSQTQRTKEMGEQKQVDKKDSELGSYGGRGSFGERELARVWQEDMQELVCYKVGRRLMKMTLLWF